MLAWIIHNNFTFIAVWYLLSWFQLFKTAEEVETVMRTQLVQLEQVEDNTFSKSTSVDFIVGLSKPWPRVHWWCPKAGKGQVFRADDGTHRHWKSIWKMFKKSFYCYIIWSQVLLFHDPWTNAKFNYRNIPYLHILTHLKNFYRTTTLQFIIYANILI